MNAISRRLVELRDKFNFSQSAFQSYGLKQKTLSNWEKGGIPENFEWIKTLAHKYETSVDYILGAT